MTLAAVVEMEGSTYVTQELPHGPLAEVIGGPVTVLQSERIYLFGPHSRGDAPDHSDYELLVMVPRADELGYRLSQQAHVESGVWAFPLIS